MRDSRNNIQKYTKLFEQIANHIFKRCINLQISISCFDQLILSLKIENFVHLHMLFCLVAAFFRFILHTRTNILYNEHEYTKYITSLKVQPQKVKCKRFSV